MELETLEDIFPKGPIQEYGCNNTKEAIRKVGIKWIKELRFRRAYLEVPLREELESSLLETERWIIYFFKITEEELNELDKYKEVKR